MKVKWGKELYNDVDLNTDDEPVLFKAQLYALTGVQPHRQKIMIKGAVIKDESWENVSNKVKNGATLLLMGSKEEDIPKEITPAERTQFLEDMDESQLQSAMKLPAGLTNLGNTCYLNATVQCFKTVPELKQALLDFEGNECQRTMFSYKRWFQNIMKSKIKTALYLKYPIHWFHRSNV